MKCKVVCLFLIVSLPIALLAESTHELTNSQEYYIYFGPDVCTLAQDLPLLHKHILANTYQCEQIDNVGTVCNAIAQGKTTAPLHVIKTALYEAVEYLRTRESTQDLAQVASNLEAYLKKLESGNVDILVTSELNAHDNARDHVCRSPGCTDYCVLQACKLLVNSAEIGEQLQVYGDAVINGNEAIGKDLTVCGNELIGGNLTVLGHLNATIEPVFSGNLVLRGTPQQACIVFVDAQLNEKARICSSPIAGDKGVFVSVNQGATQNLRVTHAGGVTIAAPTSGTALSVTGNASAAALVSTGNGTSTAPALQLINNPASTPTDFLLTIDGSGIVRQGGSANFVVNGCQPGPVTIGTTDATALTLATNGCTDRLSINANGAVTIATPDAGEVGLTIAGGGETITAGDLELVAGNIILPVANAAGTQGLVQLGGVGPTNVSIYEIGTRNLFAGNGAVNATVTGTDNSSIGTDANNTLTTANNTIAIGTTAQASGTDSIALGDSANTAFARAIAIGSADSTSTGAGPTAGAANALALGSASGTLAGPSALGSASMAIGSSDGFFAGATASGDRSVALGASATASADLSIALGSGSGVAGGAAPAATNTNAIAIGSANNAVPGPIASGLSATAIGSADATGNFAGAVAAGDRSIAIGVNANTSATSSGAIGIGSASGTIGGTAPSATDINAIAIGSGHIAQAGASASGISAIAIGGADGPSAVTSNFPGAVASGERSIAIGVNATASADTSIALGSASGSVGGAAALANMTNAIAIGSANGIIRGALASGLAAVAIGSASGGVLGATATGDRSVAIGNGASTAQPDAIVLGNAANTAVRVGVGTSAPAGKVHVIGAAGTSVLRMDQVSAALTSAPVWQNPSTSAVAGTPVHYNGSNQLFGFTSSKRYKTNIRALDAESEIIYQLTPVIYDSKEGHGEGKDIPGFIAEDVYAVAPNLVVLNSDDQPETIAYSSLYALAVKELQKQQRQIEEQDSIMRDQASTIEKLLALVEELQRKISRAA